MSVLIVTNAASGRGRARRLGAAIAGAIAAEGEKPEIRDAYECTRGGSCFDPFEAVLLVGGDGTLHHLLPELAASATPVYHVPAGTENLFAREFGMTGDAGAVCTALRAGRVQQIDLAVAAGRRMALMLSVGPDAGVIHRLHASRSRAWGHAMYARPIAAEALRPHLATLRVVVDGKVVVAWRRGLVVVANSRQYARRLNPARDADMTDGLLDTVFLPAASTARVVRWGFRCAIGEHLGDAGVVFSRGRRVRIETGERVPWQCDGEAGDWLEPGEGLDIEVEPGAMRVLLP